MKQMDLRTNSKSIVVDRASRRFLGENNDLYNLVPWSQGSPIQIMPSRTAEALGCTWIQPSLDEPQA